MNGEYYANNNKINTIEYLPKKVKSNYLILRNNIQLKTIQRIEEFSELKDIMVIINEKEKLDNKLNNYEDLKLKVNKI